MEERFMVARWWRTLSLVLATVLITLGVQAAMAGVSSGQTQISGRGTAAVKVVRDIRTFHTASSTWVDLPGASTTVTVPPAQQWIVLARFGASSGCAGGYVPSWCTVRILVGGVEADPAVGTSFVWESSLPPCCEIGERSLSIDRSIGPLAPGSYPVQVQVAVTTAGGTPTFSLDDWVLTVEAART